MKSKSYSSSAASEQRSLSDYQWFGRKDSTPGQPQYQETERSERNESEFRYPPEDSSPATHGDARDTTSTGSSQLDLGFDLPPVQSMDVGPSASGPILPPPREPTPATPTGGSAQSIWRTVLEELKLQLPANEYQTWVRDSWAIAYEDGELIVGVPSPYTSDWLNCRLRDRIQWALRDITKRTISVKFRVQSPPIDPGREIRDTPLYAQEPGGYDSLQATDREIEAGYPHGDATSVDLHGSRRADTEATDRRQSGTEQSGPGQRPDHHAARVGRMPVPGLPVRHSTQLNAHHTFDSFVVGNNNRMAEAAAAAVADTPGQRFNPLFIYGGVGLGKTHLLHAIGNRAQQHGWQVLYCSSETFTNDLINAIRSQSTQDFRNKYRQVDILLIDDIQFIGGKESTQEEFFHTFNQLHANGRQIVLTSDRPPKALATLEERLRSRFEGGVQTDISKPDFETRVAILQSKALKLGLKTSQEVLTLIAERIDSNVRELEGALNQFALQLDLHNHLLTYDEAAAMLETITPNRTPCAPARVLEIVADYFDLSVADLVGVRRTKAIAWPRQIAMYLLREDNQLSLPAIGTYLGDRDHTTIRYGVERIAEQLGRDDELRQHIIALRDQVYMPFDR